MSEKEELILVLKWSGKKYLISWICELHILTI